MVPHTRITQYMLLILLLTFWVPDATIYAQDLSQEQTEQIDTLFESWDRTTPGAALAVIQGNEVVYKRGYGMANLEYDIPITPASVFMIASVSKQFTAFAIALLHEQGRLSLDAPIQTYVPEMYTFEDTITVRHLVHHMSGLRDEFNLLAMAGYRMDDVITKDHILNLAYRQRALNFTPGDQYMYCNTGYTLMAEIVERVTGEPFNTWMANNIFSPLGMTNTHVHADYESLVYNLAESYAPREGGGYKKQVKAYQSVGASNIYTTVEDLAKWVGNFSTRTVTDGDVHALIHTRGITNDGDTLSYAFGHSLGKHRGHERWAHSGSHRGYRSYLIRFPEANLAIVLLSNLDSFNPTAKALEVADVFLMPTASQLSAYVGTYYSEELDARYHLQVEDDQLVLRHQRNRDVPLTLTDLDQFSSDAWWLESLHFERDANENLTGFTVNNSRARNIQFLKQ